MGRSFLQLVDVSALPAKMLSCGIRGEGPVIVPQQVRGQGRVLQIHIRRYLRELKNILEQLCVLSDGDQIEEKDLFLLPEFAANEAEPADDYTSLIGQRELPAILDLLEEKLLRSSVKQCDSTYSLGKLLGISQATAVRKLQKYGLRF